MASHASTSTPHTTILDIRPGLNYDTRPAPPILRTKRTRAKRSCDLCRKKKTRCDANVNKSCSSCANVNLKCTFLVEQKKRGPAIGFSMKKNSYVEALESRLKRMEALVATMESENATTTNNSASTDGDNSSTMSESMDYHYESGTHLTSQKTCKSSNSDSVIATTIHEQQTDPTTEPTRPRLTSASATTSTTALSKEKDDLRDPWIPDGSLSCDDIINATDELTTKLGKITIIDYERTRYIGMSSGVHLLHQGLFSSNKRHAIKEMPSWFVQKVNGDEEEHILIKSEARRTPRPGYLDRTTVFKTNIPHINQERLDILVQTYFSVYHFVCPIVNKMSFLEQYYYQDPSPCDEYLLCAICAIGIRTLAILDRSALPSCIMELTMDEFFEMGQGFQNKASSIFNVIYKRSRISSLQTLILFTMFIDKYDDDTDDADDTSYWFRTGMAIRMAQDLGLHRSSTGWHIPEPEMELRRRIWYITYLMDRWVGAEMGRPVSILDQEFDTELPSLYEVESCNPKDLSERPFVPDIIMQTEMDIRKKTPIYAQFYHAICLGQIFGQILSGLHSPKSKLSGRREQSFVRLLDKSLKDWKLGLPSELLYSKEDSKHQSPNTDILLLAYNCTLLLLYRPFISEQESGDVNFAFKALNTCTMAANNILTLTENMNVFALSCIRTISMYSIFQAIIIFLHNAKRNNIHIAEVGAKNLLRCALVIRRAHCLPSTRIASALESIGRCFSVDLDEQDYSMTEMPDSLLQQRRKRDILLQSSKGKATATSTILTDGKEPEAAHITKANDGILEGMEKHHTTKYSKPDLATQFIKIDDDGTAIIDPTCQRHHISTRPEDMFLSSLYRAPATGASTSSVSEPPATDSYSSYQQKQPCDQVDLQQQIYSTLQQSPPPPESSYQLQNLLTKQHALPDSQHQPQQYALDLDLFFSNLPTPPAQITFPLETSQHQTHQPYRQQQTEPQLGNQQNQQQSFDMTCLPSDIPLNGMPNSNTWEDWDSFLKSNFS